MKVDETGYAASGSAARRRDGLLPGSAEPHADQTQQLRIALVAPPYFDVPPRAYGGIETVVADLADALVARGHDVTLLGAGSARYRGSLCTAVGSHGAGAARHAVS